jgi:Amt family ammonium transporter
MTPAVPAQSEATLMLSVFFIALVPLAGASIALINSGLGRSRSAAHSMLASLCVIAVAAIAYFLCGHAWLGYAGRPSHIVNLSGKPWDWLADERFFLRGIQAEGWPAILAAWLQMLSVGVAALIPLGAGSDRWRLGASCASTALLAGWTYQLFAHWVWGGGWLTQLGVNYGLGRGFLDAGGGSSIHVVGGLTALAIAWILGPRRGKYAAEGMPAAIPGHNVVLALLACVMALLGWLGLNSAGAILFAGTEPIRIVIVGFNTMLAAASAGLAGVAITRIRFGKPDASLCANAWISGLVAISPACTFIAPAGAVIIGAVAGTLVIFATEWFELHLRIDDPGGSISVHALSGIWGLLALGLFVQESGQWVAQLAGVATLIGFVLPLTYGLNWMLNRVSPQRVSPDGEQQGMDLYELGAGAYPEFITRGDDFLLR